MDKDIYQGRQTYKIDTQARQIKRTERQMYRQIGKLTERQADN
jgi:hypothetical protein